jgi:hypothetical protein
MQPSVEYKKLKRAAAGWIPIPTPPELVDVRYVMKTDDDYYDVKKN